jgi:multidrug resistance efflux pump
MSTSPQTTSTEAAAGSASPAWQPPKRQRTAVAAIVALAVAIVLIVLALWGLPPFANGVEITANAYVRGRTTVIAPQVSGYVVDVLVRDYEKVRAGQVLARIDDRIYRARVDQAGANLDAQRAALANSAQAMASRRAGLEGQHAALANARAQLSRARADMERADDLATDGAVSVRERDQTVAALRQAEAQLRQAAAGGEIARQEIRTVDVGRSALEAQVRTAQAQLRLAQIDLDNTVIRAVEDGQVGEIGVRLGQYVTNGTQLLSLVPPTPWVIANFKEAQTRDIAVGQKVVVSVDALGGLELRGVVERLAPAAGSEFSVLKADNGTGNFVKIPQRIGVRVEIEAGQALIERLRPGMSVEVRVDTRSKR